MPAKGVGNYIHVKTYTMLATRRVGFLFFSRPTIWGEVGEGNFALPPTHAQLHGPARAIFDLPVLASAVPSVECLAEGGSRGDGNYWRLEPVVSHRRQPPA